MRVSAVARTAVAAGLFAAVASCGAGQEPPGAPPTGGPSAQPAQPHAAVGALFIGGGPLHTCSGAVLDSPRADLILTAAHCLTGDLDATFVPGYDGQAGGQAGGQPEWSIEATFVDQRWVDSQDPRADFAIARVSRDGGGSVRTEAGGGLPLGRAPTPGTVVAVTGYPVGFGGGPISCTAATVAGPRGFPALPCDGLTDGLSGSPWLAGTAITGLVGGLDGGGCDESVSYTPIFDDAISALLARAEEGGSGDDAPTAFGDDCS
ncbi:serine protease [Mycobacterium deserti]|uniref:Serine protease n=1 Tax=Mycobacterium deserti TaxID=2978347 RepID=A0ABT2MB77_9MYCO|nr:serine protease [Mycobacterium deserti]MCT7659528.1 serine protease [Mycobacterium deserti]